MIFTHHGICSIPTYRQGWTIDSNVDTSLGHNIPMDDASIDMSLHAIREMPFMHTVDDDASIEMSLVGVREMPYMHTVEDSCGIGMSLISIEEIT